MSTDIVHWEDGRRHLEVEALKFYLHVSLPLTAAVLAIWAGFQMYKRRKERKLVHNS